MIRGIFAKRSKYFNKLLAVLSAMALLMSYLLIINVSAAHGEGNFTETFETATGAEAEGYYKGAGNAAQSGTTYNKGQYAQYVNQTGIGYNSDSAMRMTYSANDTDAASAAKYYTTFSVGDRKYNYSTGPSGTWRPQFGQYYRISFRYKIESLTTDANLVLHMENGANGLNLGNQGVGHYDSANSTTIQGQTNLVAAELKTTDTTDTWVQTEPIVFQGNGIARTGGLYFLFDTLNDSNRSGSSVLIDEIVIESVNISTLTFEANGGTAVSAVEGIEGDEITVPAPSRYGMIFDGWFSDADCSLPITKFPAASATVYAGWIPEDAYVQSFEDAGTPENVLGWGFESTDHSGFLNSYYQASTNGNNVYNTAEGAFAAYTPSLGPDARGGTGVMKLHYTKNHTGGQPAAFSLCTTTAASTWRATADQKYRITFWYKTEKLTSNAAIKVYNCSANLSSAKLRNGQNNSSAQGYSFVEEIVANLTATQTAGAWTKAEIIFTGVYYSNGAGVYISLEMDDDNNRVDSSVLIDDVVVDKYVEEVTKYGNVSPSADRGHTGSKSIKITAGINEESQATSRVVYAGQNGNKQFTVGKMYTATAWVYAPVSFNAKFRLVNDYDLNAMATWRSGKAFGEKTFTIAANTWTRIQTTFSLKAINNESEAYISFGITAASGSGTYDVYFDDISIGNYTPDFSKIQDYESFEVKTYDPRTNVVDGTIHGNGSGITVTADQNHTTSGGKALELKMNRNLSNPGQLARTVLYIDKGDFSAKTGQGYKVTFWAYSAEALATNFGLGTTGMVNPSHSDAAATRKDLENDATANVTLAAGTWTSVTVTVPEIMGAGGAVDPYLTLAAWFDGASDSNIKYVYIDDVRISPYIPYIHEEGVQDFEAYTGGETIGLSVSGGSMVVSNDYNRTQGGEKSAKVTSTTSAGGTRPQMMVKIDGNQVMVEAGKDYTVSFWIYIPTDALKDKVRYWLTATDDETPFANGAQKDAVKIFEQSPDIQVSKGEWKQISIEITNCSRSGKLRFGICSENEGGNFIFYLDDITVKNNTPPPEPTGIEDFESYTNGETVGLAASRGSIVVSEDYNHTPGGGKSAKAISTTSAGGTRPQMMIRIDGNQVMVEAGKDYAVSFWVYLPTNAICDGVRYWLTATDDETPFTNGAQKDAVKIFEQSPDIPISKGEWKQINIEITNCSRSGKLRLGICSENESGDFIFYLDDIAVKETSSTPPSGIEDFESYASGNNVGLAATGGSIVVSEDYNHTQGGGKSAKVSSSTNAGGVRPQMMVKIDGQQVNVEAGKDYTISFWVYIPAAAADNEINYWLTANNHSNPFTAGAEKDASKIHEVSYSGTKTNRGEWKQFTAEISNCAYSGMLRLGICTTLTQLVVFYIDDIAVKETSSIPPSGIEDFESYASGTNVGLGASGGSIIVSEDYNHTPGGGKSAKVTSNTNAGGTRPQMMVKIDGEQVMVEAGEDYTVTFWAYLPLGTANNQIRYWLTATSGETAFTAGAEKDAAKIHEVSDPNIVMTPGEWKLIRAEITNCAFSGKLRLGICSSVTATTVFFIDDIDVRSYIPYDSEIQDFEYYTIGTNVGLAASGGSIVVSRDYNHTPSGGKSGKVTASTTAGGVRPQMMVKINEEQVKVEAGKNYEVSFWVYMTETSISDKMRFWLTATDSETAFTQTSQKEAAKIYEAGNQTMTQGDWTQVRAYISGCAFGGKLRLGICSDVESGTISFYIDDIQVKEIEDSEYEAVPGAEIQNFEKFNIGEAGFVKRNIASVSNKYNHTPGGSKSLELVTKSWSGIDRNQILLIDPATGKPYELTKDVSYEVTFWVYMAQNEADYFLLNFWLMCTDFQNAITDKTTAEYDIGGYGLYVETGEWYEVKLQIIPKNGKYLMLGISDNTDLATGTTYYLDDLSVLQPKQVTVSFDTNGSADVYDPIILFAGWKLPELESKTTQSVDPYKEGYKFTGWYTDKACTKLFDVENDVVTSSMTLYAGWAAWTDPPKKEEEKPVEEKKPEEKEPEVKYKTIYEYERVRVEDDDAELLLESGDRPEIAAADALAAPGGNNGAKPADTPKKNNGLPIWALSLIIATSVVICGGIVTTIILLKKKKSGGNTND